MSLNLASYVFVGRTPSAAPDPLVRLVPQDFFTESHGFLVTSCAVQGRGLEITIARIFRIVLEQNVNLSALLVPFGLTMQRQAVIPSGRHEVRCNFKRASEHPFGVAEDRERLIGRGARRRPAARISRSSW